MNPSLEPPTLNLATYLKEKREEAMKETPLKDARRVPFSVPDLFAPQHLITLVHSLAELSRPRTQVPDVLLRTPILKKPIFQKLFLKVFNILFREQQHFNATVLKILEESLTHYASNKAQLMDLHTRFNAIESGSGGSMANEKPNPLPKLEQAPEISAQFYDAFEKRFRGSRESIQTRQKVYMPVLHGNSVGTAEMPIIDIGCGRCEWLELLKANGFTATGVDTNSDFVQQGLARKLNVVQADAITFLSKLPAESIGAVTGFHIIEHLPFQVLMTLFKECHRVLKPGGIILFETPNPENVQVGCSGFYLDPTHQRPLPPGLVEFVASHAGFSDVTSMKLNPDTTYVLKEDGSELMSRFNAFFYGPLDYAVVAKKE